MSGIQDFLIQLINIESITGNEKDIAFFLRDFLKKKGLNVNLFPVEENRYNLLASLDENPEIILTTHMDTVAPFIKAHITDNAVYGRGACDAKGQIAAMVFAYFQLEINMRKKCGLLFVIAEETNSIGAKAVEHMNISPRYFINGEPTGNKLVHAQRGVFFFEAIAKGKASHSGYPEHGQSAIDILLEFLNKIKSHHWPENNGFGATSFNIGKISGGEAVNTLASQARAECGFRIVSPIDDIEMEVLNLKPAEIEISTITKTPALTLFVPHGINDSISVGYGSDVHFLQKTAPALMMGPGSILNAHTQQEHILIDDLQQAVEKYRELAAILINE
jgi:acetylornithine deacetylase